MSNIELPEYDGTLLDDLNQMVEMLGQDFESPLIRRMMIFSSVAYITARVFVLKWYMAQLHGKSVELGHGEMFTPAELCALTEVRPHVSPSRVNERPMMVLLSDNIKFTFNKFASVYRLAWKTPQSPNWAKLQKLVNARNRLTHPKKDSDLEVSDEDLKIAATVTDWFDKMRVKLLHDTEHDGTFLPPGSP